MFRILLIPTLLAGCSTPTERAHGAIMDQIERRVQLPAGSGRLDEYARIYTSGGKDQVIAVYAFPLVIERLASETCSDMSSTGTTHQVACIPPEVRKLKAGERTWVQSSASLPFENVKGCELITLAYDTKNKRFQEIGCVGRRSRT